MTISLISTLLLVASLLQFVLSAPRGTLLRRRVASDNVFFQHEQQGDFLIKHNSNIAAADHGGGTKSKSKSKVKTIKLEIQQTTPSPTGSPGGRFGKELAVTTVGPTKKQLLTTYQGEVYPYTFSNRLLETTPPPTPLARSTNTPITQVKAYKNWLLLSSATDNNARGIVELYNLDNLGGTPLPPIRGSKPGDYFGKSIDITVDETDPSTLPLVVVGGNGFVSTYRLALVNSALTWVPVGGGCLSSSSDSGNITGDGFGSQVAFGNDSSGTVLLYIASPLYDKNRKRQMVGRIQAYKLSGDVWQDVSLQLGRARNGKFGSTMTALDHLVLVSTPYYKGYKGAATLYAYNSKKLKLRKSIKLIQPSSKDQVLFGTSLELYKDNTNRRVYMGVGSIQSKYNVGLLQVFGQDKKKARKLAEYMEDKREDTCGVYESFVMVEGEEEGDIPGIVAGGPYCDEVYVLGEK